MSGIRESLDIAVSAALREEIKREVAKIEDDAKLRVERAVRTAVANITMRVHEYYNVEQLGDNLVITVKITDSLRLT